jgi:hypothetical protein
LASLGVLCGASVLLLCSLSATASLKSKPRGTAIDQNYVAALATAHRFLQAWENHDQETAVLLLSDAARKHVSDEQFTTFIETEAPAAYEITRGRKIRAGLYAFPVALFPPSNQPRHAIHPRYSELMILNTGKDGWAIDKLP